MSSKRKAHYRDLFPFATYVQLRLAKLYVGKGLKAEEAKTTVAVDVSYDAEKAYAAAVVYRPSLGRVLEVQTQGYDVHFPYVPGYLYLREAPAVLRTLMAVESSYDLILVDAHGRLHPRRAGLATIVGVLMDRPTVGVAKSILKGKVGGTGKVRPVFIDGKVEGWFVDGDRPFYVSPGNRMGLMEVKKWIKGRGCVYPVELVEADRLSRELRGTSGSRGPS
jgi:deoxyribonuclease V